MKTSTCARCGEEFTQSGKGRPKKYCRWECGWEEKPCEICGEQFLAKPGGKVCGRKCSNAYLRRLAQSLDHESRVERGRKGGIVTAAKTKGKGTRDTYLKSEGKFIHQAVAEAVLGRPFNPGEVVHHEDENKKNNSPDNLIVFPSQSWHIRHHNLKHPGNGPCSCPGIRLKELLK